MQALGQAGDDAPRDGYAVLRSPRQNPGWNQGQGHVPWETVPGVVRDLDDAVRSSGPVTPLRAARRVVQWLLRVLQGLRPTGRTMPGCTCGTGRRSRHRAIPGGAPGPPSARHHRPGHGAPRGARCSAGDCSERRPGHHRCTADAAVPEGRERPSGAGTVQADQGNAGDAPETPASTAATTAPDRPDSPGTGSYRRRSGAGAVPGPATCVDIDRYRSGGWPVESRAPPAARGRGTPSGGPGRGPAGLRGCRPERSAVRGCWPAGTALRAAEGVRRSCPRRVRPPADGSTDAGDGSGDAGDGSTDATGPREE